MVDREKILYVLRSLEAYYRKDPSKKFQNKALQNGIRVIEGYSDNFENGKDLMKQCKEKGIKGIGEGIAERIDEILSMGTLKELDGYQSQQSRNEVLDLFMSVTGVGDKRAIEWYEGGYRNLEDIKSAIYEGKIGSTHHITMGMKYYEDLKERIPRNEIDAAKKKLAKIIKKVDKNCIFEICGSYRRGQESSGDMDVIISNPKFIKNIANENYLKRVVEMCVAEGFIIDHLTEKGDKKYMGFCKFPLRDNQEIGRSPICKVKKMSRRIDIRVFDYECFWAGILYFTGNKEFNIKIRNRAIEKGYSLNEYGLTKSSTGERVLLNSEEEIFSLLEIPYQSPLERNISFL